MEELKLSNTLVSKVIQYHFKSYPDNFIVDEYIFFDNNIFIYYYDQQMLYQKIHFEKQVFITYLFEYKLSLLN